MDERKGSAPVEEQAAATNREPTDPSAPGTLARIWRRVANRLLRFALQPQAEFNTGISNELAETSQRIRQLAGDMARSESVHASVEALEDNLPKLGDELRREAAERQTDEQQLLGRLDQLENLISDVRGEAGGFEQSVEEIRAVAAGAGPQIDEVRNSHGETRNTVAEVITRIERIEIHLTGMQSDIGSDLAEMRAASQAQGRQVDEVAGELVANGMDLRKLRKKLDKLIAAQEAEHADLHRRVRVLEARFEPLTDLDHFDFAKAYRGNEQVIRERLQKYARNFGSVKSILDFGCGRGEFLSVCSELGIGAYGYDSDPDMVSHCKLKNLDVFEGDALEHLRTLPSRCLDGVFSAQVVEHLTPAEIVEFVQLSSQKLKRGGKIVIETINPETWSAMRWFYLDPSHSQPVPAAMMRFFLEDAGFDVLDVMYSSPVPEEDRLSLFEGADGIAEPRVAGLVKELRRNNEKINEIVFGPQDYAIVAEC